MIVLFEDAYINYLNYISVNLKEQSVNSIKGKFKVHILPYFKSKNIFEITTTDYLNFQIELEKKDLSYYSKRNIHFILSGFFNFLVMFYNLPFNIISKVGNFKKKNIPKKKLEFYNLEEFKKFISFVDFEIYKLFFTFMFFTGTRPGEAMALSFEDIKDGVVSINKTIDEHGKRTIGTPKTTSSYREILIDNDLSNQLEELKKYYFGLYDKSDVKFVFGGIRPLSPSTINRHKKKACSLAKIKEIRLHDFRHSHANLLIENGVPINAISYRLGHSDSATTLRVYVHNTFENEKRVLETLSALK